VKASNDELLLSSPEARCDEKEREETMTYFARLCFLDQQIRGFDVLTQAQPAILTFFD